MRWVARRRDDGSRMCATSAGLELLDEPQVDEAGPPTQR